MMSRRLGGAPYKYLPALFFPSPMTTLIDPRPLEPAWVTSAEPDAPDEVRWQVETCRWDKQSRSTKKEQVSSFGTSAEFLELIAGILRAGDYCHTIHVESSDAGKVDNKALAALKYPSGISSAAWWCFAEINGSTEEGLDADELFDWLKYLLDEGKDFVLTLEDYDPTP